VVAHAHGSHLGRRLAEGGHVSGLRRCAQAVGFYAWALVATGLAWSTALIGWLLDPVRGRLSDRVMRLWGRAMLAGCGIRVVVEGREHLGARTPRVLVANHASWLDPLVMAAVSATPPRFVLKQELRKVPFIGWHTWLTGHFLIDREDPRAGMALLEKAVERARRLGLSPMVFPEGTRSADGRLQALRGGAVQIAMAAGMDLQPFAILGTHDLMPRGASYPRRSGVVTVRVGPAIPSAGAKGGPGRRALTEAVRSALLGLGVPDGQAAAGPGR
jgi:1-acyl-sn-glycerol-3-phosphate acyltransferase